jgi:3-isopropylmalate dehydratase small subunit
MRAFGIRCVIGPSPAEFFRDNCLKNGVLPITLDAAAMQRLTTAVLDADGREPFTVDLTDCAIRGPRGFDCAFEIDAFERMALLEGLDDIGITHKQITEIEAWEARTARDKPFLQASIANVK